MSISAEAAYNFLTSPEAQGKALVAIDLDDFPKDQHQKLLVAIDEAQDTYAAVFQVDGEKPVGAVVVEDADSDGYTLTPDTYMVCVFYEHSPNTWVFIFRQGKAQRKVWNQEQNRYTQVKPDQMRAPYYGFQLEFEPSTSEDDVAKYIVDTLTRYRGLVSSIAKPSRGERLKRLYGTKGVKRPSGYRKHLLDLYQEQKGICGICGEAMSNDPRQIHVDHIRPVHLGGNDDPDNLRAVHAGCNLSRTKDDYQAVTTEYAAELKRQGRRG